MLRGLAIGGIVGGAGGAGLMYAMQKKNTQHRKIVILFGPPGSGKGTQAPAIVDKFDLVHLSTGDMLRAAVAAKTEAGMKAKAVMEAGGLVNDDILMSLVKDRVRKGKDCGWGCILDGFPRTLNQAQRLDALLEKSGEYVTHVLELKVPERILEERICGRWIHKTSGRSYNTTLSPPKSYDGKSPPSPENMRDDETGEALMQRSDDTAEALKSRLHKYHNESVPVVEHYKPTGIVTEIDAVEKKQCAREVMKALNAENHSLSK